MATQQGRSGASGSQAFVMIFRRTQLKQSALRANSTLARFYTLWADSRPSLVAIAAGAVDRRGFKEASPMYSGVCKVTIQV